MAENPKQVEKPRESTVEFLVSLATTLVPILFVLTFVIQGFAIPSGSMENTLLIGDHAFVDRLGFAPPTRWIGPMLPYRDIQDGEIFVFFSPSESNLYVVKRVIGVPGDRIHLRDGVVYRNGKKLDEPYVIHSATGLGRYNPYRDDFPSVPVTDFVNVTPEWQLAMKQYIVGDDLVVPPGSYFAMGDNRDVSLDSRYWGFVPRQNVIGRPLVIYWSFITSDDQYLETGVGQRLEVLAHTLLHFFDETRWRRTFKVPQ